MPDTLDNNQSSSAPRGKKSAQKTAKKKAAKKKAFKTAVSKKTSAPKKAAKKKRLKKVARNAVGASSPRPKARKLAARSSSAPLDEERLRRRIAVRAYELWQARGCVHGAHDEDWLEAERQIRAELKT